MTIIVNGIGCPVAVKEMTYEEIVDIGFGLSSTITVPVYTVTYRGGDGDDRQGILTRGQSIGIQNGMIFNVALTNNS